MDDIENRHKGPAFPFIPPCVEGKFNEEVAKQQIDIIFIAGHETTASTIAYAILMLAMHPEIQEQVFDELHSIYETQNQEVSHDEMQRSELLDRVIKETMRLFPSVYLFSRTSMIDVSLKSCVIPKGSTIALPVYTMHRVI